MAKQPNLPNEVKQFCRWHLGRDCFAPMTGQDWPAWNAFVHLVQCWTHGGGEHAIEAMKATVRCAQPTSAVLRCFVQAIPAVGDWCHVRELWPKIASGLAVESAPVDAREMFAVERGEQRIWHHGLNAPSQARLS